MIKVNDFISAILHFMKTELINILVVDDAPKLGDLLEAFVKSPNQVLSRDQLIDHLKGYERSPFDRSIGVRVTRLRKKLGPNGYIQTIRGSGYLFIPQPAQIPET